MSTDQGSLFEIEEPALVVASVLPRITAATDGSCDPNPGPAAGAWYVSDTCWGAEPVDGIGTNNIGELVGIRALLQAAPPDQPLEIVFDSQYAHDCLNVWIRSWSKGYRLPPEQWRRGPQKEPVKNAALIGETYLLMRERSIVWTKAKAHVALRDGGHALNHAVDLKAGDAVRALKTGGPVDTGPGWSRDAALHGSA
ncbi:MAG: ribonuclease [Frankiales bacterium]|nr:ribonuclease [Frankiales bacterium]